MNEDSFFNALFVGTHRYHKEKKELWKLLKLRDMRMTRGYVHQKYVRVVVT